MDIRQYKMDSEYPVELIEHNIKKHLTMIIDGLLLTFHYAIK